MKILNAEIVTAWFFSRMSSVKPAEIPRGLISENMERGSFIISKVGKWEQHSKNQNDSIPNWKPCTNYTGNGVCNWMLFADDPSDLCWSCRLSLS